MIDYILPMADSTACVITSESEYNGDLAFIKFSIVHTRRDLRGNTLFKYETSVRSSDYTAWNEAVKVLEGVARRIASYKETHPKGLGYLDRAYVYIDDAKPELEKLRS